MNHTNKHQPSCTDIKQLFADHLTGDLDVSTSETLQEHLQICSSCNQELAELSATWSQLGILPEEAPSENLRKNFYHMLNAFDAGQKEKKSAGILEFLKNLWPQQPAFQFALSLAFLLIGFIGGLQLTQQADPDRNIMQLNQIKRLQNQSDQLKQHLTISLLDESSPSQRMKGLTYCATVQSPNNQLIGSILDTLNTDPNTNVRLSAIEALYLFADSPRVKDGLVNSLKKQNDPLVQVALIDLLVKIREKRSINALKSLLKEKQTEPSVKTFAQKGIRQLI